MLNRFRLAFVLSCYSSEQNDPFLPGSLVCMPKLLCCEPAGTVTPPLCVMGLAAAPAPSPATAWLAAPVQQGRCVWCASRRLSLVRLPPAPAPLPPGRPLPAPPLHPLALAGAPAAPRHPAAPRRPGPAGPPSGAACTTGVRTAGWGLQEVPAQHAALYLPGTAPTTSNQHSIPFLGAVTPGWHQGAARHVAGAAARRRAPLPPSKGRRRDSCPSGRWLPT